MSDPRPVVCPNRHAGDGPAVEVGEVGQTMADRQVLAALSAGTCPACPGTRLTEGAVWHGSAELPARRCRCCGAAWQHGIDWWALAAKGRLTSQ